MPFSPVFRIAVVLFFAVLAEALLLVLGWLAAPRLWHLAPALAVLGVGLWLALSVFRSPPSGGSR